MSSESQGRLSSAHLMNAIGFSGVRYLRYYFECNYEFVVRLYPLQFQAKSSIFHFQIKISLVSEDVVFVRSVCQLQQKFVFMWKLSRPILFQFGSWSKSIRTRFRPTLDQRGPWSSSWTL